MASNFLLYISALVWHLTAVVYSLYKEIDDENERNNNGFTGQTNMMPQDPYLHV